MWNIRVKVNAHIDRNNKRISALPLTEIGGTHYIELPPFELIKANAIQHMFSSLSVDDTSDIEVKECHIIGTVDSDDYDDSDLHLNVGLYVVSPHKYIAYKKSKEAEGNLYIHNDYPTTYTTTRESAKEFEFVELHTLIRKHDLAVMVVKV